MLYKGRWSSFLDLKIYSQLSRLGLDCEDYLRDLLYSHSSFSGRDDHMRWSINSKECLVFNHIIIT